MTGKQEFSELGQTPNAWAGADQECPTGLPAEGLPTFEEVVRLYHDRVSRLAYRLLGWDEQIEDVVQDVFLAALKNLKRFRGESSLWTWLAAITMNRCRTLSRRRRLRMKLFSVLGREFSAQSRSADPVAQQEKLDRVRKAVRELPVRLREVAVLRYLEETSIDQIAQVLRISRNAVEVRLHRARTRLKDRLADMLEEEP